MEQSFGEGEQRTDQEQSALGVRVLMRDGQWIGDVPEALRAQYSEPRDCVEPVGKVPLRLYPADMKRPVRHVIPKKAKAPPKVKAPKPKVLLRPDITVANIVGLHKCGFTRGQIAKRLGISMTLVRLRLKAAGLKLDWGAANARRDDITSELVFERWRAGKTTTEIAAEFGCGKTIVTRMARRSKDELVAIRSCACGGRKFPWKTLCHDCDWRRRRTLLDLCACGRRRWQASHSVCKVCQRERGAR